MAGSPMTGGQTQKANHMDMGRYVGNPNHMNGGTMQLGGGLIPQSRLETGGLRLPGADLQAQQPDYMKGFQPPRQSTMDKRQFMLDGKQMTGSSTYIGALQDHLKSIGKSDLFSEGTGNVLSQTPGLQGTRDANGNLVNNNVYNMGGATNNRGQIQAPINSVTSNGLMTGGQTHHGQIGAVAPPPMNINTMAVEGLKGAGAGTVAGMGYTPEQVGTVGSSATVTPQTLSGTNLDAYMNPYTDSVIKANEADILRGAKIGLNELSAQAQAAGSFGGSRHGLQGAELGKGSLEQLARSSAGLRQSNFANAQQMALQDIQNNMQGQLANQQGGIGDINRELQASLANQSAGLQGAQQRLGAANQLGQLSNLGFGMGQQVNQNLATQGAMQQALQQMVMDNAANKFNQYTNYPAQGLGYLTSALNATPLNNAMYKNTTETKTKTPGLFDYLSLGAQGYTGGN